MTIAPAPARIIAAYHIARNRLLSAYHPAGYWEGRLSSSALSTATALSALALAGLPEDVGFICAGVRWLSETQCADGGWGDTTDSPSNLATTLLATSALTITNHPEAHTARDKAHSYLKRIAGDTPAARVSAITAAYGEDRTFAVPILLNCALAGLVPWDAIPGLPFELAAFPHVLYKALRLNVVSYALPALIAVGLLLHHRHPPRNPLIRIFRNLVTQPVLAKLARIQPKSGGFLEATPLTSFVAMSLLPRYGAEYPVVRRCLSFLRQSFRADGSWPIDTNLSVWMTTSAVTALASSGELASIDTAKTRQWILARQYRSRHPYTNAAPGGWGWTHLPGGVPDADDTAGAMIALGHLSDASNAGASLLSGAGWLLHLQNRDGGWPTFCRGWGSLPFDKSSPDVTAHVIRALHHVDPEGRRPTLQRAITAGFAFLQHAQREDGAWLPLWFGNQAVEKKFNPVLGTARVLRAYADFARSGQEIQRAVQYLINSQDLEGGWGGDTGVSPSTEETALAVIALRHWREMPDAVAAWQRGITYLVERIEDGTWFNPTPIGLYFASLWYSEELYPIIWTVEALGGRLKSEE